MPYNMPKKMGGDTQAIDSKMESCVAQVMKKGKSKSSAVAICKSMMMKKSKMDKMMK